MEVFLTAWFCHTPLQSRSFRRHLQELSNRILSKWSIHIPHCITWFSFVVYCQVERWFLIIHLCRTMASERFVKENGAKCVVAGLCYGTEWPTRYFAIAAFWSSLGGPNQFFIAGFSVNLKLYITHPTSAFYSHRVLGTRSGVTRAIRQFFAGLHDLGRQICLAQTPSPLLHLTRDERFPLPKSRNNCLFLEERASRENENFWSFRILRVDPCRVE